MRSRTLVRALGLLAGVGLLTAAEQATLDFAVAGNQIRAADGASACQFDAGPQGSKYNVSGGVARCNYSGLGGFPNDQGTAYGAFMDACFSTTVTYGMGLHHLWVTPSPHQCPPGSLPETYAQVDWSKMDFSLYEPGTTLGSPFWYTNGTAVKAHTTSVLRAALKRCRAEGTRMLFWGDLHFTFPTSTWKDLSTWYTIPESQWPEAALYEVTFIKYLTARHGVPIHALSFMNEPNVAGTERSKWTPDQMLRFCAVLRAKLDEAGLHGVRIIPATQYDNNLATQEVTLLTSSHAQYDPIIDILGVHHFGSPGIQTGLINHPATDCWVGSGNYSGKITNASGYLMGANANIDETIRLGTWRLVNGYELSGVWQLFNRAGMASGGWYDMPSTFDPASDGTERQRDGAAAIWPFVRPGMHAVGGSQGTAPSSAYSVDGWSGRGHRPCITITNSGSSRTFAVTVRNLAVDGFAVYQASAASARTKRADATAVGGVITITVPADSVTTLVGAAADTLPRAYLVVGDAAALTADDTAARDRLVAAGYDVRLLNQTLTAAERTQYDEKRHPIDAMGAAVYVLSSSVTSVPALRAHDAVMAPVVVLGDTARVPLKLAADARVGAGSSLSFRDTLDPPASLLSGGLPLATGPRAALPANPGRDAFVAAVAWATGRTSAPANQPPTVALTAPASGASATAPATFDLAATAADSDGSVTRVEFHAGTMRIGEDTTAPYTCTWSGVAAGTWQLTATAYDDRGATTQSAGVTVTVSPATTGNPVLMIINGTTPAGGDAAVKARLEALGHTVTVKSAKADSVADATGKALVLISSTVTSSDVGATYASVAVPVMVCESYVLDDMGMTGPTAGSDYGVTAAMTTLDVVGGTHPLAAGLAGAVTVTTSSTPVSWGAPGTAATIVARPAGQAAQAAIFAYDAGQAMRAGTAPARRVGFHLGDATASSWTDQGRALFDAAVTWAIGAEEEAAPVEVGVVEPTAPAPTAVLGYRGVASGTPVADETQPAR